MKGTGVYACFSTAVSKYAGAQPAAQPRDQKQKMHSKGKGKGRGDSRRNQEDRSSGMPGPSGQSDPPNNPAPPCLRRKGAPVYTPGARSHYCRLYTSDPEKLRRGIAKELFECVDYKSEVLIRHLYNKFGARAAELGRPFECEGFLNIVESARRQYMTRPQEFPWEEETAVVRRSGGNQDQEKSPGTSYRNPTASPPNKNPPMGSPEPSETPTDPPVQVQPTLPTHNITGHPHTTKPDFFEGGGRKQNGGERDPVQSHANQETPPTTWIPPAPKPAKTATSNTDQNAEVQMPQSSQTNDESSTPDAPNAPDKPQQQKSKDCQPTPPTKAAPNLQHTESAPAKPSTAEQAQADKPA